MDAGRTNDASRWLPRIALLALSACGGAAPAPPPPPRAAAPQPPPVTSAPVVAVPAGCRGADLDLDRILGSTVCDVAGDAAAPPPEDVIGVELTPARETVRPGETIEVTLALVNRTTAPVQIDLDAGCVDKSVAVLGLDDARADRTGLACVLGDVCRPRTVRLVIEPGGRARDARSVAATVWRSGPHCELEPAAPLPPGPYRIHASSSLWERRTPGHPSVARGAAARLVVAP